MFENIRDAIESALEELDIVTIQKILADKGIQWVCSHDFDGEDIMCVPTVEVINDFLRKKLDEMYSLTLGETDNVYHELQIRDFLLRITTIYKVGKRYYGVVIRYLV